MTVEMTTYIGYYKDGPTDIYVLVRKGEMIDVVRFATHGRGNKPDKLVGRQIELMH